MREFDRITELYPSLMKAMSRLRDLLQEGMDLTYNQYKTLLTLYDQGPCPLGHLSARLRVAVSSASEMIDRLERAGLASRQAGGADRRTVAVAITPAGEQLLRQLREGVVENYRGLLDRLTPPERGRLVRAIEDLVEIVDSAEGRQA